MTSRSDFTKYNHLKRKLETEINREILAGGNPKRLIKLQFLRKRCFPTKEEVIGQVQTFFKAEEAE